jgi:hypothetical protein
MRADGDVGQRRRTKNSIWKICGMNIIKLRYLSGGLHEAKNLSLLEAKHLSAAI